MFTIVFLILCLIGGLISYLIFKEARGQRKKGEAEGIENEEFVRDYISLGCVVFCSLIFVIILLVSSIFKVDAGEAIILIEFGQPYEQEMEAGLHLKRPWADTVEWITRLKALNEQIETRSKDDMKITTDLTIWWAVQPDKLDILYSKISKNYETLEISFVIPAIRSAIRDEIAKATFNELNTNREVYADKISDYVAKKLSSKYVIIDRVNIRNIIPPESVNKSIEEKLQMEQAAQKEHHKLELTKKKAEVMKAEAIGSADAEIERAKGVAKANRIIGSSLKGNESYLRYLWIQGLQDGSSEVIYIPTEANLPILEATRKMRKVE